MSSKIIISSLNSYFDLRRHYGVLIEKYRKIAV
jgi:hypothetical protein